MADVTFTRNELAPAHPGLAVAFEHELRQGLSTAAEDPLTVQIRVDSAVDGALERAWILVVHPEWMREWSITLPVVEGDVFRSVESTFQDRQPRDRRREERTAIDRRGEPAV